MKLDDLLKRIAIDPKVMVGKPVIAGTRIPVDMVLRQLAQGLKLEEILANYPHITEADIRACLLFASRAMASPSFMPLEAEPA